MSREIQVRTRSLACGWKYAGQLRTRAESSLVCTNIVNSYQNVKGLRRRAHQRVVGTVGLAQGNNDLWACGVVSAGSGIANDVLQRLTINVGK